MFIFYLFTNLIPVHSARVSRFLFECFAEMLRLQDFQIGAMFAEFLDKIISNRDEERELRIFRRSQFLLLGVMKRQGSHVLN